MNRMKRIYKIFAIIILTLLIIWLIPIPDYLAFKISLDNTVKGDGIGFTGYKPAQFRRYQMLKTVSSTKKLLSLFNNHKSPVVKCYSFWALQDRSDEINLFELISNEISDDRKIKTMFGCDIFGTTVADFLIRSSIGKISYSDSLLLDSLILYSDIDLDSKTNLLLDIYPNEEYYSRIKYLTINSEMSTAIVGLAKYQNEKDIDIIINKLKESYDNPYYALLATGYFLHEAFLPDLLELQEKLLKETSVVDHNSINILYKILILYDNDQIGDRLEDLVKLYSKIQYIKSSPDSTKEAIKSELNFFDIQPDSFYNNINKGFERIEYVINTHFSSLSSALNEYPDSKYNYLFKKLRYNDNEVYMIDEKYRYSP